jgi:ATP-binding cassette subfamily B protein
MKSPRKKTNLFKYITKYITEKQYLVPTLFLILTMLIANLINLATPQITANILDQYIETETIANTYKYIFIGIIIIGTISTLLQTYLTTLVGEKIGLDLRNRLTKKILSQEYKYIIKEKPSKLLTVILSDVNYIKTSLIQVLIHILISILLLAGSTYLMFSINPIISTYIVLIVPVSIGITILILKKDFYVFKESQKIRDKLNKVISENIKGSMLIRVFVSEKDEQHKFQKANKQATDRGIKISNLFATAIPTVNGIATMASLVVLYFGGKEVINSTLTIGELTALNSYIMLFTMPLIMIAMMSTALGQAMASLGRINNILDSENTFENGDEDIDTIERIETKNLSLNIEENQILKNINFEINKGEKIGIIGLTGSGKSMFLKTLNRSLDPQKGEVLVNGKNIKEYEIESIRERIGFSLQENFLITGTILDNIIFGREITKDEALKAAKIANVDEFAEKFEEKYEHQVGERGTLLSGGQKQRVMIARSIAKKPELLILDDATSRLDITTESKIFENINNFNKDISIILIAQKISSIKDCDRIYIFEEGKIDSFGTHEELRKTSLLYQEIELTQRNYNG